ncbi:MAG: helix-turn-helix transcriptional regulator [Flavonifractor plautii]
MFKVRIRELRESAGYKSQQSFADAFGVAQSTVGGWEAGKREPNFQTLMRLADFLIRRLITFWAVPVKRLFPSLISPPTTSRMWSVPF